MNSQRLIDLAREVLETESKSILNSADRLGETFAESARRLANAPGRVVVFGIGKSGHVARKFSSTLSSYGIASSYLHPAEALHGDLGMVAKGDVLVGVSFRGNSPEFPAIFSKCSREDIPLIAITGKVDSELAKSASLVIDASIAKEACPMGLAPTTSSTVALALCDALAVCASQLRGVTPLHFAENHPGGGLGRKLLTRVSDLMHTGESLPLVGPHATLREVVALMTKKEVRGVAGVVNEMEELIGVITDGDVRRAIDRRVDFDETVAKEIMSENPKVIDCFELAEKALFYMREFQIKNLFAIDSRTPQKKKPVGHIEYLDLLKANLG